MSDWLSDEREIRKAKLAGNGQLYDCLTGDRFERFERNGEYCMLPWIRVTTWKGGSEAIIEAALTQTEFIEFSPAQGMAPEGRGREGGPGSSELPSSVAESDAPKGETS